MENKVRKNMCCVRAEAQLLCPPLYTSTYLIAGGTYSREH